MKIELPCQLEERISKDGNKYLVCIIALSPNYEKKVFLESAELELVRLTYSNSSQKIKMNANQQ